METCAVPVIEGELIGPVRTQISMMIIGAPQCRQIKSVRISMRDSTGDTLSSAATCNKVRTFARLAGAPGSKQSIVTNAMETDGKVHAAGSDA